MNIWLWAALALMLGLVPCGWVCVRGATIERLVALELAGVLAASVVMLLAEGYERRVLYDVALGIALLSFPSGLVFAHFLERWL